MVEIFSKGVKEGRSSKVGKRRVILQRGRGAFPWVQILLYHGIKEFLSEQV